MNNNDQLDNLFNNLHNIIDDLEENGDLNIYSVSQLRLLINRIWHKKMQDLEGLFDIEDFQIRRETNQLKINNRFTKSVRREYDFYMKRVASVKNLLEQVVKNNRIVPLEKLLEKMKGVYEENTKNLVELEKQLYKVKVGTLEGLTRDVIANKKVEVDEDTVAKDVLSQGYDEMNKLFPNGPRGGKRRSSRKYKNNKNKTNKTKRRRG